MKTNYIKSVLRSATHGYELVDDSMESWNRRGSLPLHNRFLEFETFGDGMTKHSPAWCVQFEHITDACLSLTAWLLDNLKDEAAQWLATGLDVELHTLIKFAFTVKYKEDGVDRFYSTQLHKIGTKKEHDKRFEKIMPRHDGTPKAVFEIVNVSHNDGLRALLLANAVRDYSGQNFGYYQTWEDVYPATLELKGDWQQAITALSYVLKAVMLIKHSTRAMECSLHNCQNEIERAEKAAQAAKAGLVQAA